MSDKTKLERAEELIRSLEYSLIVPHPSGPYGVCPMCNATRGNGHYSECSLGEFLKELEKE